MNDLFKQLQEKDFIIAGPCVIENEDMIFRLADKIKEICVRKEFLFVFKSSFDKANRTSRESFRGPGLEEGLKILERVKKEFELPVLTDIHESGQAKDVAEIIDIIQIPAFLSRQTDLLVAAGETGKIINIKKGQFLAANDMRYSSEKVRSTGNSQIMLTERGTLLGYGDLVVDFRNIVEMKKFGFPVVMDVTHSIQKPGGLDGKSGGNREYVPYIALAARSVGVNGHFFEVHEAPDEALCDGPNMVTPDTLEEILRRVKLIPQFDSMSLY